MGTVNIQGLGNVRIEGDTPTEKELDTFKRMIEAKGVDKLTSGPAEEATESFLTSPKFGRILTEVGLSIAGTVATGGLALPGIALRAGMLARPFLTQLAKSAAGSGAGGGVGAIVSQSFDPKEDVVREVVRAATEGALGEAIGAPVVIKGGQVVSKLLSSKNPKEFNSLLDGAADAENALKESSQKILNYKKIIDNPNSSKEALKEANKFFDELTTSKKSRSKLIESATEIAEGGLTPGVKSSNRTLEIIENISQKSLLGGGAISRRYEAATDVGNVVAKDVLDQFKVTANEAELGELFLSSLAKSEQNFIAAKNSMYKAVDDIIAESTGKARVIPVEDPLRKSFDEIRETYSEIPIPDDIATILSTASRNIDNRQGLYSFAELQKLREAVTNAKFALRSNSTATKALNGLRNTVDDLFKLKEVPQDARLALEDANKFFNGGQEIFDRGIVSTLLKQAATDGMLDGKSAKAIQTVFKTVAGGDNLSSTRQLFREIDAMTGKTVPEVKSEITGKAVSRKLNPILNPDTKKPILSQKDADLLKQSFRGQFITNALRNSESGGQFGSYYDAKKFASGLSKGGNKLRKFLFQGADETALDGLENTLNFAQGDLSRLTGLPGGIFIQMKQAGAAGSVLQMANPLAVTGGQLGAAGLAAGFLGSLPAITILAAPAIATKVLLNPKFQSLMFREPIKNVIKATNMSKEEFLSLSQAEIKTSMNATYRQIIGRMFSDGYITKQERDDQLSKVRDFDNPNEVQPEAVPLPDVNPGNFPVIETVTPSIQGGGSNAQLAQALNLFNKGGIASVRGK
jgi:hypothetical protein